VRDLVEITVNSINMPLPQPTQKVFSIRITATDEKEIDAIVEAIKVAMPEVNIKDTRVEAKP